MADKRRVGSEQSATRTLILDATQALMVEEGYAAVSTRRVAARAGIKPALVQYYFPVMDDLLLTLYRRAAQHSTQRQRAALESEHPWQALWTLISDSSTSALAIEFMALANHRKSIRTEIARHVEESRKMQMEILARRTISATPGDIPYPIDGLLTLLAVSARGLVMEHNLGVSSGHDEAAAIVNDWLESIAGAKRE